MQTVKPRLPLDLVAYREFITQYQGTVYRLAYGILGNREDADEIAQQVFMKAYFSNKSFDAPSSLYIWIYRIAVDQCYRFLRKRPDAGPTTHRAIRQRDLINKLVARISGEDRHLLLLRELEGYSPAKISELTGLSENKIKRRLLRVQQRLDRSRCKVQQDSEKLVCAQYLQQLYSRSLKVCRVLVDIGLRIQIRCWRVLSVRVELCNHFMRAIPPHPSMASVSTNLQQPGTPVGAELKTMERP